MWAVRTEMCLRVQIMYSFHCAEFRKIRNHSTQFGEPPSLQIGGKMYWKTLIHSTKKIMAFPEAIFT
jgi:hypothetical protein